MTACGSAGRGWRRRCWRDREAGGGGDGADAIGRKVNAAMNGGDRKRSWGARLVVLVPYLWLVVFFLVPFLIVVKISLSHTAMAQPPYTPVFDLGGGWTALVEFLRG